VLDHAKIDDVNPVKIPHKNNSNLLYKISLKIKVGYLKTGHQKKISGLRTGPCENLPYKPCQIPHSKN
jgi:hypothetical protein